MRIAIGPKVVKYDKEASRRATTTVSWDEDIDGDARDVNQNTEEGDGIRGSSYGIKN